MNPGQPAPSPQLAPGSIIYKVGSLSYNKNQLIILFFWLMWNDFSLMLVEQVGILNRVLMKNHGATFTHIGINAGGMFRCRMPGKIQPKHPSLCIDDVRVIVKETFPHSGRPRHRPPQVHNHCHRSLVHPRRNPRIRPLRPAG